MRYMIPFLAATIASSQLASPPVHAAPQPSIVTVRLIDVASGKGQLLVSLCDKATFMKRCASSGRVAAKRGDAVVTFRGIKPGRYAVMAFHDENSDGRMGRTAIGSPSEGWGFSRDAQGERSAPAFDQAAIDVTAAGAVVPIHLIY